MYHLEQAIHQQAQQNDMEGIQFVYLERSGSISVIPYRSEPRVVTVGVENGVQTVRIQLKEPLGNR